MLSAVKELLDAQARAENWKNLAYEALNLLKSIQDIHEAEMGKLECELASTKAELESLRALDPYPGTCE